MRPGGQASVRLQEVDGVPVGDVVGVPPSVAVQVVQVLHPECDGECGPQVCGEQTAVHGFELAAGESVSHGEEGAAAPFRDEQGAACGQGVVGDGQACG